MKTPLIDGIQKISAGSLDWGPGLDDKSLPAQMGWGELGIPHKESTRPKNIWFPRKSEGEGWFDPASGGKSYGRAHARSMPTEALQNIINREKEGGPLGNRIDRYLSSKTEAPMTLGLLGSGLGILAGGVAGHPGIGLGAGALAGTGGGLLLNKSLAEKGPKAFKAPEWRNAYLNELLAELERRQQKEGIKMGSLMKMAEKVAQEEERYSPAERVKIAAANLCNFVAAVKADGGHIKTASAESGEVNHELIVKVAGLYVADHYKTARDISLIEAEAIVSDIGSPHWAYGAFASPTRAVGGIKDKGINRGVKALAQPAVRTSLLGKTKGTKSEHLAEIAERVRQYINAQGGVQ